MDNPIQFNDLHRGSDGPILMDEVPSQPNKRKTAQIFWPYNEGWRPLEMVIEWQNVGNQDQTKTTAQPSQTVCRNS